MEKNIIYIKFINLIGKDSFFPILIIDNYIKKNKTMFLKVVFHFIFEFKISFLILFMRIIEKSLNVEIN